MFFNLLLLLPVIPTSLALPFIERSSYSHLSHKFDLSKFQGCPTSGILVPVPMGLSVPNGQTTSLVTVGRGIQNYTCTNGAYVTAGHWPSESRYCHRAHILSLYDVSCLFDAVDDFIAPSEVPKVLPEIAYSSLPYPDTYGLPVTIHHLFM